MSPSQLIYFLFTPFISQLSVVSDESPVNLSGVGPLNQSVSHQQDEVESIVQVSDGGGSPEREPTSEEPEIGLNQVESIETLLSRNFPSPSDKWRHYRGSDIPFKYNESRFEESDKFEFLLTKEGLKCTIKAEPEADPDDWEVFPQVKKNHFTDVPIAL